MAMLGADSSSLYWWIHSQSWLAWSEKQQLPGTQLAIIKWMGELLQWLCHNDSTISIIVVFYSYYFAFSAITLLVGYQEEHLTYKNWVMRYWHGYLSGARCKWFACDPADATATPIISCFINIQIGLTFLVLAYPSWNQITKTFYHIWQWKKGHQMAYSYYYQQVARQ